LAFAVGVGNNKYAAPVVRGAKFSGGDVNGHRGEPGAPQVTPHSGHPLPPSIGTVLDEDGSGTKFVDDAEELRPEAGLWSRQSRAPVVGGREVVAREPADDDVDRGKASCADAADVLMLRNSRPVPIEHPATERADFDLPEDSARCGALDALIEAADA
jgi:hypothetical protein